MFEQTQIPGFTGLGDGADVTKRTDEAGHGVPVLLGGVGAEDGIHLADAERLELRLQMVMAHHLVGPMSRHHSWFLGRDAVAITPMPVSWRASWMARNRPAGAPDDQQSPGAFSGEAMRSNRVSQAVMAVSGRAAASDRSG